MLTKKKIARKKVILTDKWKTKFQDKLKPIHKQFTNKAVNRIMRRATTTVKLMTERSKKCNVPCTITVEEVKEITYSYYGQKCRFCKKRLVISNLVYDHIIPIAKGGPSTKDNIQIICNVCNRRKGSLDQDCFIALLNWLESMPEDFARDILTKLSGWRR